MANGLQTRKIEQGETLSGIAGQLGTSVEQLVNLNLQNPGALPDPQNPGLILAGGSLNIPTAGLDVQRGEPSVISTVNGRDRFDSVVQPTIDRANEAVQTAQQTLECSSALVGYSLFFGL